LPRVPKEEFGRMIFQKNLPWGTVLNFSQQHRQVLAEAPERVMFLRALNNEAESTVDLPKHGAVRAYPWLSTALVAGSVRRGIGWRSV